LPISHFEKELGLLVSSQLRTFACLKLLRNQASAPKSYRPCHYSFETFLLLTEQQKEAFKSLKQNTLYIFSHI